jgi:hypothetical protein
MVEVLEGQLVFAIIIVIVFLVIVVPELLQFLEGSLVIRPVFYVVFLVIVIITRFFFLPQVQDLTGQLKHLPSDHRCLCHQGRRQLFRTQRV